MCGRFVGYRKIEQLNEAFPIDVANIDVTPNYNVAPNQEILAIARHKGQNYLEKFHWGLVPFWTNDTSIGNRLINARSETAAKKTEFQNRYAQVFTY